MVGAAPGPRDDVVNFQVASLEVFAAARAITGLDPIERLAVCTRRWQRSEVCAQWDVRTDRDVTVVEHRADAERRWFPKPLVHKLGGLWRDINAYPAAV